MRANFPFTPARNISPLRIDRMYGKVTLPRNVDGRAEDEDAHPRDYPSEHVLQSNRSHDSTPSALMQRFARTRGRRGRCRLQTLQSCDEGPEPHLPRTG
jgi:hypothetical protein